MTDMHLRLQISNLESQINHLLSKMPCGHPFTAVDTGDEGTSCCLLCAYQATIASLREQLAKAPCPECWGLKNPIPGGCPLCGGTERWIDTEESKA